MNPFTEHSITENAATSALAAWENWNSLGFKTRSERLSAALSKQTLPREAQKLLQLLLERAARLEKIQELPGPTGECNELYLNGRGVAVVHGTDQSNQVAFLGQLITALVSGNCVLASLPSQTDWCESICKQLHAAGIPETVLQHHAALNTYTLSQLEGISLVAPVCTDEELITLNRQLAERNGLLVQLIPETDPVGCTHLLQPDHMLRFVTEKTRSINTTAVGGNATLLELGNG